MKTTGWRPQRVGEQIREELSALLVSAVRDPRIGLATVTAVDVSPDLRHARIFVSVYGDAGTQAETLEGFVKAKPFIRRELALRLNMRRIPELHFELDQSAEYAEHIEELLRKVSPGEETSGEQRAEGLPEGAQGGRGRQSGGTG